MVAGLALLRDSRAPHAPRLDPGGILLATLALLLLLYPLVQGRDLGWPGWTWAAMAASVPVFALFAAYERRTTGRSGAPLVDLGLFRYRSMVGGLLVGLVFFAAATGHAFVLTLYLQEGLGFTPLATAVAFLAFPVGVAVGSGAATQLVPRLGRRMVTGGGVVMALGFVLLIAACTAMGPTCRAGSSPPAWSSPGSACRWWRRPC